MARITIDIDLCRGCGRCVDICPEELFVQKAPGKAPRLARTRGCIGCGHCVSVCEYGAIDHPDFPAYPNKI